MTSISTGRAGAVGGARGPGGAGSGVTAGATMVGIAANVSEAVARELGLTADADGRRGAMLPHDLYGIEQAAGRLADSLGASPFEAAEILRLLHLFAAEVAARVGAVPDARSVEEVGRLVAECGDEARTAAAAIHLIDKAVRALAR